MSGTFILRADGSLHTSDVRNVKFGLLEGFRHYTTGADSAAGSAPVQPVPESAATAQCLREDECLYTDAQDVVLLTSSRDKTSGISLLPSSPTTANGAADDKTHEDEIVPTRLFAGHEAFVNFAMLHKEGLDFLENPTRAQCDAATGQADDATLTPAGERRRPFLLTGGNDSHVVVWNINPARVEAVLDGHQSGVTCGDVIRVRDEALRAAPLSSPGAAASSFHGDIVTGDWSGVILIFSHAVGKVKATYTGHANAIRGIIHVPGTTLIVSVSGDKTVHCWDFVRVAGTARADKDANTEPLSRVLQGHEDVVQCVCYVGRSAARPGREVGSAAPAPGSFYAYVATGSNDCTVRLWAVESRLRDAHPVKVLSAHDSLIYGLCYNAFTAELFSASEDRSVRVWGRRSSSSDASTAEAAAAPVRIDGDHFFEDFAPVQVILHPCVVWTVAACRVHSSTSGDEDLLLTGGSDSITRLWTRDENKFASVEKLEMLQEAIAAQKVDVKLLAGDAAGSAPNGGGGGLLDLATMPPIEQLAQYRGAVEGEKKLFKTTDGEIVVFVWAAGRWDRIGVVVSQNEPVRAAAAAPPGGPHPSRPDGAAGAGLPLSRSGAKREKKLYKGKSYDYLFDVDVDGKMLQLPYNVGDSVFEAAQDFINAHSAVQTFTEEGINGMSPSTRLSDLVIVSQEHKEEIVNFIMQNIDEADLQSIPGLGGGSGQSPPAAAPPPPTSDNDVSAEALAALLQQPWSSPELQTAFNADGAQRKVTELLAPPAAASFAGAMARVQSTVTASGGASAEAVNDVALTLGDLLAALPAGQKFPALDAARYAVSQQPQYSTIFLAALLPSLGASASSSTEPRTFAYTPAAGADALVLVRLLSNVVAALATVEQVALDSAAVRDAVQWALYIVRAVCPALAAVAGSGASSDALAAAVVFGLRNVCLLVEAAMDVDARARAPAVSQSLNSHTLELNLAIASFSADSGTGATLPSLVHGLVDGVVATAAALTSASRASPLAPALLRSLARSLACLCAAADRAAGGRDGSGLRTSATAALAGASTVSADAAAALWRELREQLLPKPAP